MGLSEDAQQTRFNSECDAISVGGLEKENVSATGDPGKISGHSQNKEAAESLVTPDLNLRVQVESEEEISTDTDIRNLSTVHPSMEACPSVLEGPHTEPSTPSGGCLSPFIPSFEDATKILAFPSFFWAKVDSFIQRLNRWSKNTEGLVEHFCAHMKLGGSMPEMIWGKMSLGTKIVAQGGIDKMFKLSFNAGPTEKLLKTSACYLSTSSGPLAGLLFISTEKIAFCSDRPLSFTFSKGGNASSYYKVVIPLGKVKSVNLCENVNKPSEKCIQFQTVDNHEFWFMAFINYQKAFKYLQQALTSN